MLSSDTSTKKRMSVNLKKSLMTYIYRQAIVVNNYTLHKNKYTLNIHI